MLIAAWLSGCAVPGPEITSPTVSEKPFNGDGAQKKSIFVFLDGTRNDPRSGTNVRKLFEAVVQANDPQTTAMYIEGVGSAETPILGAVLGFGMEPRILRGYDFIAQSYKPNDDVYIFGFSRGAHQARALAGLIAYAGVPPRSDKDSSARRKLANAILENVKRKNDDAYKEKWAAWQSGALPFASEEIFSEYKVRTLPVEIKFLGLWDTVPGSYFKEFGVCKEQSDGRDGDRYKSDSYPSIQNIFHAVALDEKRSKFKPILLCPPLKGDGKTLVERWFPGAHADVGGGYEDSQALPGISLRWMMEALAQSYAVPLPHPQVADDPLGLAHWSIGDRPANAGSDCEDRIPPANATIDPSVKARSAAGQAQIRIQGAVALKPYPMSCPGK
ncbi:DUF2235 domain-containing protein [Massilia sp. ST3]|uniref:phospholipase effector Tle1 domain-containing protein n=1 Tax=Massilia sp. ST3 TaxID=2824903 RepID=UPI001B81666B|nr:DUF2235 domain-containing protein [Massilia sp. ST3]MBQ5950233.1 DUF2235 domain-containing protein [Massilia sp. ST3]